LGSVSHCYRIRSLSRAPHHRRSSTPQARQPGRLSDADTNCPRNQPARTPTTTDCVRQRTDGPSVTGCARSPHTLAVQQKPRAIAPLVAVSRGSRICQTRGGRHRQHPPQTRAWGHPRGRLGPPSISPRRTGLQEVQRAEATPCTCGSISITSVAADGGGSSVCARRPRMHGSGCPSSGKQETSNLTRATLRRGRAPASRAPRPQAARTPTARAQSWRQSRRATAGQRRPASLQSARASRSPPSLSSGKTPARGRRAASTFGPQARTRLWGPRPATHVPPRPSTPRPVGRGPPPSA
jgi:hypothetical protein